jgi:hypothetical protein
MKQANLFWAIVWGVICVLCVIGIFWNPCQIATAVIAGFFCGMFIHDYRKTKDI